MRKRMIEFLAVGALALTFINVNKISVHAATTSIDGVVWAYTLSDGQAANVYAKSGAEGELIVPDKLNGYPVVSLGGGTESTAVATNITSISYPESVENINDYAFYNSSLSNEITISNVNVGNYAFAECDNLEKLSIKDDVNDIGAYAFTDCSVLNNIDIQSFTGNIGAYAFSDCTAIEELYVGKVGSFGDYAFKGCTALKNLEVDCIQLTNQFQDCYNLMNIVLDESVEKIENDAFLVKNAGVVKADLTADFVKADSYYVSKNLMDGANLDSKVPKGTERNWYFKNPNTSLGSNQIYKVSSSYQTLEPDENPIYGWVDKSTYSVSSIFFPHVSANVFTHISNNSMTIIGEYLTYAIQYNGHTYKNSPVDTFAGEYYNTASGYAVNNIYVNCSGNPCENTPEYAQESAQETVYESMSNQAIKIYDTSKTEVEAPSYLPVPVVTSIAAKYDGSITEGMELDTSKITVTQYFSDNTTEDVDFSSDCMTFSCDSIKIGKNPVILSYDGFSYTFEVEGIEKKLVNLKAELNTSVLTEEFGYNNEKKSFLEGSSLTGNMFNVTAAYNNETSESVTDFTLNKTMIEPGENIVEVTYKNIMTSVSVMGSEKQLIKITAELNTSNLSMDSGYDASKEAFQEGSALFNDMFIIVAYYDNGTTEQVSDFVLNKTKIDSGKNIIEISYKNITTSICITGSEKQLVKLTTELNTSDLSKDAGYDASRGAFQEGSSLSNDMFIVIAYYDNGTNEIITDFSLSQNQVAVGNNSIEISYNGVSTKVTVVGYSKEAAAAPDKDTSSGSTTPGENTSNTDNNTNTSGGSTPSTNDATDTSENDSNSDKNDKKPATPNKDNNKTNPSKDKKPSKDKTTSKNKDKNKTTTSKKKATGTTTSAKKNTSKTNKKNSSKKKTSNKSNTSSSVSKKTSTATTKSSITQNSDVASGSQGSIPIYVDYGNAENPSVKTKDDEVKHLNKKKKNNNKDKDELQEGEKTLNKADDVSISSDDIMYDSIDSDSKYNSNEVVETDTNKKVDVSKKKSGFSPVFIIGLVIISIAVVGFILNRRNKEEDEEEEDENQQYKEEKLTSDQEAEFVEE